MAEKTPLIYTRVHMKRRAKRTAVGTLGGLVVIIGIIAIPYPGPGWLIVFTGLAILATEFDWAKRLLDFAKGKYDAWQAWLAARPIWIRALFWIMTCIVVVVTIWLFNGYGILNSLLQLHQDWLRSPLPIFR